MNKQGRYIVPFKGLKEGIHEFNVLIDNKFFEIFDFSEIREGHIKANVLLNKKTSFLELSFDLSGDVSVMCDRCLENFLFPVSFKTSLYVNFGNDFSDLDENIIIIPYSENQIDISQYIYEFIILSLPLRRVHPDDPEGNSLCDKSMLKKLDQYSKKI